jgi:hypothetical protein
MTEIVEEKVFTYKSELTEKDTVEADMDDRPAMSMTGENEVIVLKEFDPYGPQRIYSIQTGSFKEIANAYRYFNFLMREFEGSPVNYTRIEKIGVYYAVRIGKFNGYTATKQFLEDSQPLLSSSIIVDNYPSKLIKAKKDLDRDGPEKIYSIQTGSFLVLANARNNFQSMIRAFDGKGLDYVRLVKAGEYYAVRLGKFDGYTAAKNFFANSHPQFSSAIILDNYPVHNIISTYSYLKD